MHIDRESDVSRYVVFFRNHDVHMYLSALEPTPKASPPLNSACTRSDCRTNHHGPASSLKLPAPVGDSMFTRFPFRWFLHKLVLFRLRSSELEYRRSSRTRGSYTWLTLCRVRKQPCERCLAVLAYSKDLSAADQESNKSLAPSIVNGVRFNRRCARSTKLGLRAYDVIRRKTTHLASRISADLALHA